MEEQDDASFTLSGTPGKMINLDAWKARFNPYCSFPVCIVGLGIFWHSVFIVVNELSCLLRGGGL